MTIKGLAGLLEVDEMTVGTWERDIHIPPARSYAKIIRFIGYLPFKLEGLSFGKQIYFARQIAGTTQKQLAKLYSIDESNLRLIELDIRKPETKTLIILQCFIEKTLYQ